MRVLLLGRGRMGKLVEALAPDYGCEIVAILNSATATSMLQHGPLPVADIAIDFTVPAAVPKNLPLLINRGLHVVVGTTGWGVHAPAMRQLAAQRGVGILSAANFSLGLNLFQMVVEEAARRFTNAGFGAWIHDAHHAAKKDAPSGTALQLQSAMERAGYWRPIDISSTRAGSIPGTHTVGFDGPSDTISLTHAVRDRAVFARGALEAARWLQGRRGWFTMRDFLESL